jgi:hypothetical protein
MRNCFYFELNVPWGASAAYFHGLEVGKLQRGKADSNKRATLATYGARCVAPS